MSNSAEPRSTRLIVGDADLAMTIWGDARRPDPSPPIVMLHDGLGSISQWRGVPAAIAAATERAVIAYERPGHGSSTPVPSGPWPTMWLHHQAELFVEFLRAADIERPFLVGHSDGGSIALIAAADGLDVAGVVAIASHSWVEPVCRDAIVAMRADPDPIVAGLARHHDHPRAVFEAWSGVWVTDEFGRWDIRPALHRIDAPVLVAQGDADEYATTAMLTDTVAAIGANAHGHLIDGAGHIVHHQHPDTVVDLVTDFATR